MRRPARARVGLALVVVTFFTAWAGSVSGQTGAPALVAVVLDTSGSIPPGDLARTRELALGILQSLPPGSEVALFTFDDQARLVLERTTEPDRLRKALEGARIAGRFTALYDALYDASRYLRDAHPTRKAIVLVTDGLDENSTLKLEDALGVAEAPRIPVYAVGVGHVQERILRRIAKLTAGDYVPGSEATPAGIAAAIIALPAASPESSASSPPLSSAPPSPARSSSASRSSLRGWLLLVGGFVVAAALALLALGRRSSPLCPKCHRPLPGEFSTCAFCAGADEESSGKTLPPTLVSETVMSRLTGTEEYLEKTVTLRERPVLAVTAGSGAGQVFALSLESATSLGRAKANDVVLDDVAISSQHCRVRPEDGRFVLHDLKSTNGTFVNDRRISRHPLSQGDVIKIGETVLQFRLDQKRL